MLTQPGFFASKGEWDAFNAERAKMFLNAAADVASNRDAKDAAIAGGVGTAQAGLAAAQAAQASSAASVPDD